MWSELQTKYPHVDFMVMDQLGRSGNASSPSKLHFDDDVRKQGIVHGVRAYHLPALGHLGNGQEPLHYVIQQRVSKWLPKDVAYMVLCRTRVTAHGFLRRGPMNPAEVVQALSDVIDELKAEDKLSGAIKRGFDDRTHGDRHVIASRSLMC